MKTLKKLLVCMLLLNSLLAKSWAESQLDSTNQTSKFKIGVIIPLTGNAASYGDRIKKAVLFAHSKLPKAQADKIELRIEDDQLQSSSAVSAFKKLTGVDQVNAVIAFTSGAGNALAPIAEKSQIPLIVIAASDFNVVKDRTFVFTHWVMPELEAQEMARELKKRDYKKIAAVFTEQEGLLAFRNALASELEKLNLSSRLKVDQSFIQNETDYRSVITKIKAQNCDATLVVLMPGAISAFTKQARSLGYTGDFVGFELFEDEAEVKAAANTLLNQWYVNADDGSSSFLAEYKQANHEPAGIASSNAYDALMLLAEGFRLHGNDAAKLAGYLKTVQNFNGAAGTYSASGDNRFKLPAAVKIVRESGFEKLYR